MNISLAVFNLLPFPPLDGSKVLDTFLPASMQPIMEMLEQYGYIDPDDFDLRRILQRDHHSDVEGRVLPFYSI